MRLNRALARLTGVPFRLTGVLVRLTKGVVSGLTGVCLSSVQSLYLAAIARSCVAILRRQLWGGEKGKLGAGFSGLVIPGEESVFVTKQPIHPKTQISLKRQESELSLSKHFLPTSLYTIKTTYRFLKSIKSDNWTISK